MRASDPNARAQGRLQGVVKVKDGPTKNRCNYDYSGLRLLAVAKYEGLPPLGGYPLGSQLWRRRDYVLYPAPLPCRTESETPGWRGEEFLANALLRICLKAHAQFAR